MIRKIDICNFGSYSEFLWDDSVRDGGNNHLSFKKLNIIYGRNYSGKTTLSRIFRFLETGKVPQGYEGAKFIIHTDNETINQDDIYRHSNVKVYNNDFARDNLKFLYDQQNGDIKSFAVLGERNNELENEIRTLEDEIGDPATEKGILFTLSKLNEKLTENKKLLEKNEKDLENNLKKFAKNIKENPKYDDIYYNIKKLKDDINEYRDRTYDILDIEDNIAKNDRILEQNKISDIIYTPEIKIKSSELYNKSKNILEKEIQPTKTIQRLINNSLLQNWVKEGLKFQAEDSDRCGFCGQALPHDLWDELKAHFNEESQKLEEEIEFCLSDINKEYENLKHPIKIEENSFYPEDWDKFSCVRRKISNEIENYKKILKMIKELLLKRKKEIFTPFSCEINSFNPKKLENYLLDLEKLISQHNQKNSTFQNKQNDSREQAKMFRILKFQQDIQYNKICENIKKQKKEIEEINKKISLSNKEILQKRERIDIAKKEMKNENAAAIKINNILRGSFGHDELELDIKEDGTQTKFEIKRQGRPAYNLSEGECSLISFIYFIVKLDEDDISPQERIIYIDDPISSLDSNHIFFIYSLIETYITSPRRENNRPNHYRYKQIFISTHNLDFLKYIRKLSKPRIRNQNGRGQQDDVGHFIIERHNIRGDIKSVLRNMPTYLRKYVTEFNYLFHQIHECRIDGNLTDNSPHFYSFGNNLRKFMEIYMFFKYPNTNEDPIEKLKKFFNEDNPLSISLINRLNNEYSHLGENPDRGMRPMEIEEIKRIASFILNKIKESDQEQYNSLISSIE